MPKRWRLRPHDPTHISRLEQSASIPSVVAQLLLCRGISDAELAKDFLACRFNQLRDPEELPGVATGSRLITEALRERQRIVVYGDYDADGMTGTSILLRCLTLLGGDVGFYIPDRQDEGYGLHVEALEKLAAEGVSLVVTVDCGITSVAEAERARELSLKLVITDHHQPGPEIPAADAMVHPGLPENPYVFSGLCGAAVAFKLAWAVCQEMCQSRRVSDPLREFLLEAVGLAAVGTIADIVPLLDENRVLVRHGLGCLKKRPSLGMSALLKAANLTHKPYLESEDIAFAIAPRLNAAGRLGQAPLAVELLTTNSTSRAEKLAQYLNDLNGQRETLERSIYLSALKEARAQGNPEQDPAIVAAGRGWHPGVIGIVASRLANKFHRPVVLVALDEHGVQPGIGSARSIPEVNLFETLTNVSKLLETHGGHAAAAGLRIREEMLGEFREQFLNEVAARTEGMHIGGELWIDDEAALSSLTLQTIQQIEQLAPFGQGNQRPLLCSTGVALAETPRRIGGGRHLAVTLRQHGVALRGVAFGNGDWADELPPAPEEFSIAFRPVINHFQGQRKVELHLVDWRTGSSLEE